jgi:fructokinase
MKLDTQHSQPTTVVGAGFFAYDVLVGASKRYEGLGGSAGNVLAILAYLGWRSVPVATLGADSAAERIRAEFAGLGALTWFLQTSVDAKTPVVYQTLSEGKPTYSFSCPVCGSLTRKTYNSAHGKLAEDVRSRGPTPSVFYFDRASQETTAIAEHYRSQGAFVVFEPSKREDTPAFRACLGLSHVVKYAADRIENFNEVSGDFVEVCTNGSAGLRFRMPTASRWTLLPSIQAPYVRDTSGSGDWCTAGAIYWFMRTRTDRARVSSGQVRQALRFGQALAALNCMQEGARALATTMSAKKLVHLGESISHHASVCDGIDESDGIFHQDSGPWAAEDLSQLCCGKLST